MKNTLLALSFVASVLLIAAAFQMGLAFGRRQHFVAFVYPVCQGDRFKGVEFKSTDGQVVTFVALPEKESKP